MNFEQVARHVNSIFEVGNLDFEVAVLLGALSEQNRMR